MSGSGTSSSSLTVGQEIFLALAPIPPATISIWSSVALLGLIWRDRKSNNNHDSGGANTTNTNPSIRILTLMSIYDISNSITIVLQNFLTPADTSRRHWAVGTDATCTALGFFFQFNYPSYLYYGVLSFYHLLSIRFNVPDAVFAARYEPCLHVLALGYPTVTAILGLLLGVYRELPVGAGCWLAANEGEEGATIDDGADDDEFCNDADCIDRLELIFGGFPFVSVFLLIVINNILIFVHVRSILGRAAFLSQDAGVQKIRAVATQAFLYVAVFFLTYIWTVILRLMPTEETFEDDSMEVDRVNGTEAAIFPVMVLRALFLPLMGFGNLLVYSRPRYLKRRDRFPNETRWRSLQRVIGGGTGTQGNDTRVLRTTTPPVTFAERRRSFLRSYAAGWSTPLGNNTNQTGGSSANHNDLKKQSAPTHETGVTMEPNVVVDDELSQINDDEQGADAAVCDSAEVMCQAEDHDKEDIG